MRTRWCFHTLSRVAVVAAAALLLAVTPTAAQISEDAPADDYEDALYGYDSLTGGLALLQDVGYVYCPDADGVPILAVHPDNEGQAMADLGAVEQANGSWALDDGNVVTPQRAVGTYTSSETPAEAFGSGTLPVLAQSRVVLVQARWLNCRRWRQRYLCQGCYHCAQGCYQTRWGSSCSVKYTGTKKFKLCRYTGNPWDWCYEYTYYRCTATGYSCNNCTGTPLWSYSWIGFSCWINGC